MDSSLVASGSLPLAIALALLAGFVSFASPCVLPLVPGFLGYVSGLTEVAIAERQRGRVVLGALLFVLGFSAVYILTLTTAAALGGALVEHRLLLMRVGGVFVIGMALVFLGMGPQSSLKLPFKPPTGLVGAPLLGIVFGIGWSPCNGPTLAAIVALMQPLGADTSPVARGVALGIAYCLGLGIPFLLIAAGYARAGRFSRWLSRHQRAMQLFGGSVLLVIGLLLVSGLWDQLVVLLQSRFAWFESAI